MLIASSLIIDSSDNPPFDSRNIFNFSGGPHGFGNQSQL